VHNQLSDRMNAEKENNKDGFLVSKKVKYNQFKCAVDSTNDRLHITFKNNLDTNVILSWRLIYKTYLVMEGSDIMAPKEEKRSAASVRKSFQNSGFKADDFILEPVEIIYY
jgi:hypothetical protein